MEYGIVIRAFNEEEHIGRLLTGVFEQHIKPKEVVVVDSGSTDATLSIASRFPVKIVTIAKEEFSYGRALNIGCSHISTDFIVLVSAHAYPLRRDWIQNLLAPFENAAIGVVYGRQCSDEGAHYSEKRIMNQWFPGVVDGQDNHTFCNNANTAVRRTIWEFVQYDEKLFGLEDVDFAKKIGVEGYRVEYAEKALVVHVHRQKWSEIYNRYYREALSLKYIYPHEHIGKREIIYLLFANIISDFISSLRERVFIRVWAEIIAFRFTQFLGTYKGFCKGAVNINTLKEKFYYPNISKEMCDKESIEEDQVINYALKDSDDRKNY